MHGVNFREMYHGNLERAAGIEPATAAWEAAVLPLNYARACSEQVASLWSIKIRKEIIT